MVVKGPMVPSFQFFWKTNKKFAVYGRFFDIELDFCWTPIKGEPQFYVFWKLPIKGHNQFFDCWKLLVKVLSIPCPCERFMFILKGLWQTIGLLFRRSLHMPLVCPILTTHGKIIQPPIFVDA
jgi:hypothetical protein